MHSFKLFSLLPIFHLQIHDIGVRGGIQGRELFVDTGNTGKRGGCRLFDVALQGAPFKFSPRIDFEMAILEDALPDYDFLYQLEELCI